MAIFLPLTTQSVGCNGTTCKTELTYLGILKVQLPRGCRLSLKSSVAESRTFFTPSVLSRVCEIVFNRTLENSNNKGNKSKKSISYIKNYTTPTCKSKHNQNTISKI